MSDDEEVVVESSVGPEFGYYHDPENRTWMGPETMAREEAEERGYSPCSSCYPDAGGEADD